MGRTFETYHDFALSSLDEVCQQGNLEAALHLTANCFESGVYRNNGAGVFQWEPLPLEAQCSPAYGAVSIDVDADGFLDLAITQNCFTMQPETGLHRGGMGLVLRGGPDAALTPLSPSCSGMVVFGDGMGLAVMDADHDNRPDLVAIQNNDQAVLLTDAGHHGREYFQVRLIGPAGNRNAIGAQLTVIYNDGHTQTVVVGNTSYLSQSSATTFWGNPAGNQIRSITVSWPDGSKSSVAVDSEQDTQTTLHYAEL